MEGSKISKEALQKALQILDLVKADTTETAAPAAPAKAEPTAEEVERKKIADEILQKSQEIEALQAKLNPTATTTGSAAPAATITITETKTQEAPASEALIKGFNEKIQALGTIIRAKEENEIELKKAVDSAVTELKEVKSFTDKLAARLGMIEKQPLERKSVTEGVVVKERFNKAEGADAGQVLSITDKSQRKQIVDTVWAELEKGGFKDTELKKAIPYLELGELGDTPAFKTRIYGRLKNEFNIQVVK